MTIGMSASPARTLVSVANFGGEAGSAVFMDLDPGRYLDGEILRTGLFEAELTRYFQRVLTPGMVCVDVGANIGYYTILFARRCRRVLAFEPMPDYQAALRRAIEANGLSQVEMFDCGLSNVAGRWPVAVGQCSATLHWVADERPRHVEEASFHRLDDLVSERVDLIKIDVDGHELRVLEGAANVLHAHRPIVVFEVSPPHYRHAGVALEDAYRWFENLRYSVACEAAPLSPLSREEFLAIAANEGRTWNFIATPAPS
jgi:FkbM family methyltransferase